MSVRHNSKKCISVSRVTYESGGFVTSRSAMNPIDKSVEFGWYGYSTQIGLSLSMIRTESSNR
jgi:hypothetical protein